MTTKKPAIVENKHLVYLDELRESGVTNMFGAAPYLTREFPGMTPYEAKPILMYWMETYVERHDAL